jgi:hypothetical protein
MSRGQALVVDLLLHLRLRAKDCTGEALAAIEAPPLLTGFLD